MASSTTGYFLFLALLLLSSPAYGQLSTNFYAGSCQLAALTIRTQVLAAVGKERRMGASLLRLHFHDCFVQGCDASILLDGAFIDEKRAIMNRRSVRGFEVIDNIKTAVESICPGVVSCADILALAARDASDALGGPSWDVKLGRRDSVNASLEEAHSELPFPSSSLSELMAPFAKKDFSPREMVALSGAHSIGQARCVSFRECAYNDTNIAPAYGASLRRRCPRTGGDAKLTPLDAATPNFLDNSYFRNLIRQKGLLHSDQALFDGASTNLFVNVYVSSPLIFFSDFANAMVKMSEISPITGSNGQVRRNCRKINFR